MSSLGAPPIARVQEVFDATGDETIPIRIHGDAGIEVLGTNATGTAKGNWSGTVVLERSFDGELWSEVEEFDGEDNKVLRGAGELYRFEYKAHTSGYVRVSISNS